MKLIQSIIFSVVLFVTMESYGQQSADSISDLGTNPYLVLDGRNISMEEFKNIDPDEISSLTVVKHKSARKIYGKKANDGAVIIETLTYTLRLYHYVDSVMVYVLKYNNSDSTENGNYNPMPPILLDIKSIDMESLKEISFDSILQIDVLKPSESSYALFGEEGKNGAIILTSKK